jgi:hypothetical protein
MPLKTPAMCRQEKIGYYVVAGMLRSGRIDPSQKDSSGDYVWTAADIDRLRKALAERKSRKAPKAV